MKADIILKGLGYGAAALGFYFLQGCVDPYKPATEEAIKKSYGVDGVKTFEKMAEMLRSSYPDVRIEFAHPKKEDRGRFRLSNTKNIKTEDVRQALLKGNYSTWEPRILKDRSMQGNIIIEFSRK